MKNSENLKAWRKAYRESHREYFRIKAKEDYDKHREKRLAQKREYYANNREKFKLKHQQYCKNNREALNAKRRAYFKTPSGRLQMLAHSQRKRAEKKNIRAGVIQMVYEDNIKKYGTLTCVLCNHPIKFGQDSIEHLIPLSRGGTHDYNNLAIAHCSCNFSKNNKTTKEWKAMKDNLKKGVKV